MREVIGELQSREREERDGRGKAVMAMAEGARLAGELAVENARLQTHAAQLRDSALLLLNAVVDVREEDGGTERVLAVLSELVGAASLLSMCWVQCSGNECVFGCVVGERTLPG
eukprot:3426423-Rhodomonas_salina.1